MLSFWVTIILIVSLVLSKLMYQRWINPLSTYAATWAFLLYLFDLRLIVYPPITSLTWVVVLIAFISFLLGCVVVYSARSIFYDDSLLFDAKKEKKAYWSNKKLKMVRNLIIVLGSIGLFGSLQHWYVLINIFGSVPEVLINAGTIYSLRVSGEHFGQIPYLVLLSFVSVYLSAVYSAYRNKFSILIVLPIIAVILHDAATFGRAGIFFAFILFFVTFITARVYFKNNSSDSRYSNNKSIIFAGILIIVLAMTSVSLIRIVRNPISVDFINSTTTLKKLDNMNIISPSLYLYFSSPISVLSKYMDNRDEIAVWGENTFYPIYNNLNRFGLDVSLESYPKGYYVPMWVNSATYIRELDVDFGPLGVIIVPFMVGVFATFFWFKYFENGNLIYLSFYSFVNVIIIFSIFYMATRLAFWFFGLIFSLIAVTILNKYDTSE